MPGRAQRIDVDIAVVGAGFAGSLTSLALTRMGRRVALIERGRHPRFAIGESSTPMANLLLEELADRYDLPRVRAFSKWGTWRRERPDVAVGLKRGFSFFFHGGGGERFLDDRSHARQLLVAASPHDEVADTHWFRADVDRALVDEAAAAGVVYLDETGIEDVSDDGSALTLRGARREGEPVTVTAGFVIDASGPRGFLHRALSLPEAPCRWLPDTEALYTHFEGVEPWGAWPAADDDAPPFSPDASALHHVFPGGWIWILRFNNGVTSAGVALTGPVAEAIDAREGQAAWNRLLERLPSVGEQFRRAQAIRPFVHLPRVAYRTAVVYGSRWALLPSAAGVIDPLLSTGFPLTLLGIERLLQVLERTEPGRAREEALKAYAAATQSELDAVEQLVAALYATMHDPALFKRLSLLYFAAASYSEAARRLGLHRQAPGFMLSGHEQFGLELKACAEQARGMPQGETRVGLFTRIARAIEPFDVAGLLDKTRRDWYQVRAEDLGAAAPKLGASVAEVRSLIARSGFDAAV